MRRGNMWSVVSCGMMVSLRSAIAKLSSFRRLPFGLHFFFLVFDMHVLPEFWNEQLCAMEL